MTTTQITGDHEAAVVGSVPTGLWIDGANRAATGSATLPVHDPSTDEVLAEVADATPEDAVAALELHVAEHDVVGHRTIASVMRAARTFGRTSWTRTMRHPCSTPYATDASDSARRSLSSRPRSSPTKRLFDAERSNGYPSVACTALSRSSTALCAAVLPRSSPASSAI